MNKSQNREAYPDIRDFVDEIRAIMSIESIKFPYTPKPRPKKVLGLMPPFTKDGKR